MRRTIIILAIGLVLLIIGFSLVGRGCNTPKTMEELKTRLTYEVKGSFDHQAYRQSTKEQDKPNPKYFAKIVDSILVSYSYQFLPSETVSSVTGQAEISAIVRSSGMWEKEVELLPMRQTMGNFSTSFPLNPDEFLELADTISKEIGISTSSPQLILKATVHTEAETESGVLKESFVQTCQVDISGSVFVWHRPFSLSRKGYWEGMTYEQRGNFGYEIQLNPNILFGATTMHSDTAEDMPLVKLSPSASYPSDTTEILELTLFCQMDSGKPVTDVSHEVDVNVVLSRPGGEDIIFKPVSKQRLDENSSITFPLDIALIYDIIGATVKEGANSDLIVKADVHTVARSDFGIIDEVISPGLNITLEPEQLVFSAETEGAKSGSFKETVLVPNAGRGRTITSSLGVVGMGLAVLLYGGWSFRQARRVKVPVPRVEIEAIQARKKHKDIIVDVQALPPRGGQVLIPIDSLDELVKVADALLKPVLHKATADKHTYYVTDGLTLYEYISLEYPKFGDKKGSAPS